MSPIESILAMITGNQGGSEPPPANMGNDPIYNENITHLPSAADPNVNVYTSNNPPPQGGGGGGGGGLFGGGILGHIPAFIIPRMMARMLSPLARRIFQGGGTPNDTPPSDVPPGMGPNQRGGFDPMSDPRNPWGVFGQNPANDPTNIFNMSPSGAGPLTAGPHQPGWTGGSPFGTRSPGGGGWNIPGGINWGPGSPGGNLGNWGGIMGDNMLRHYVKFGILPTRLDSSGGATAPESVWKFNLPAIQKYLASGGSKGSTGGNKTIGGVAKEK